LEKKKIHFIAIGGAAMHNIALDMREQGHEVTGSDDEIYEPSLSRLKHAGLAPQAFGWFPERIHRSLDFIILGMHAKADNPELLKAIELGIKVYSYPEFVYHHSKLKKRIVIAGSHGKTTTTAMVLHVLKKYNIDTDYLVGAHLEGFDKMVRLTDTPLIVIEGDEYLSSPVDRVPKILHYKPHIAVITGIAWDHINVFPTFTIYKEQFEKIIVTIEDGGVLIYNSKDQELNSLVADRPNIKCIPYQALQRASQDGIIFENNIYRISVIGEHNLQNMNAARVVCEELGIETERFFKGIEDFKGANKRLQKISQTEDRVVYLDFAHAPSKVKATVDSVKQWFGNHKLLAVVELHTFSSLNKTFIPLYRGSLVAADKAVVFYNEHTLKMKNMPGLDDEFIKSSFDHPDMLVFKDEKLLNQYLKSAQFSKFNLLLMSSGNFNKMETKF